MELQNNYVDLMLIMILKQLKQGKDNVPEAIEIMVDLGISNEILKEHLMGLSMDTKLTKDFDNLDTQLKTAFTKEYNKKQASNTTGVTKKITK